MNPQIKCSCLESKKEIIATITKKVTFVISSKKTTCAAQLAINEIYDIKLQTLFY